MIASGPVSIADEKIEKAVVDEVLHIQQVFHFRISMTQGIPALDSKKRCIIGHALIEQTQKPIPCLASTIRHRVLIKGIPVILVTAVIGRGESRIGALNQVVESPIGSIEVKVHKSGMRCHHAHGARCFHGKGVPHVQGRTTGVGPGIIAIGPQYQIIKTIGSTLAKNGEFQFRRSVRILEHQAEGFFQGKTEIAKGSPLNLDARIDLEPFCTVWIQPFHRNGTLPCIPCAGACGRIGIDALPSKPVFRIHDQRKAWNSK